MPGRADGKGGRLSDDARRARTKFLIVVDDTPECRTALRYASRRAKKTGGGVVLLRVLEPAEFQHWASVEQLMREEAREEAEKLLSALAAEVNEAAGIMPEFTIREGRRLEEILKLIDEEASIRMLVLGAASGKEGPGPLVSRLAGQMAGSMRVPISVIPGDMTPEQIEEVT